jgi:hypothetical protein
VRESAPEAGVGDCLVGKSFYYTERTRRRDNAGDAESGRRQYIPKLLRRTLLASDCQQHGRSLPITDSTRNPKPRLAPRVRGFFFICSWGVGFGWRLYLGLLLAKQVRS